MHSPGRHDGPPRRQRSQQDNGNYAAHFYDALMVNVTVAV